MAINFPSSPVQGQVYEFGDYVYTFDGVKWTSVLKYGLAAAKVSSETPPSNPEAGLMWYVPSTGESYLWYDDGDSGQWIQETPSIGAVSHRFLEGINEPGSHEASAIRTSTGISVQDYIGINDNYIALKIFQSPTDGGLTEIQTRTVDANEVYEVRKTSDNSLATIYSDADGTTEIVQNGTDNKSGSDGSVEFYIEDTFDELKIETELGVANWVLFISKKDTYTLSEAISLPAKIGDIVMVSDRANGLFRYEVRQTANSRIIDCDNPNLSLVLIVGFDVYPEQWGLLAGSNGANNSNVIDDIIAYLRNLPFGGRINYPPYEMEFDRSIPLYSYISHIGAGIGKTVIKASSTNDDNVMGNSGVEFDIPSVFNVIKDLTIDGNKTNIDYNTRGVGGVADDAYQNGIRLFKVTDYTIEDVEVKNSVFNGISVYFSSNRGRIIRPIVHDIGKAETVPVGGFASYMGIFVEYACIDLVIDNPRIYTGREIGIMIQMATDGSIFDVTVINPQINDIRDQGIAIRDQGPGTTGDIFDITILGGELRNCCNGGATTSQAAYRVERQTVGKVASNIKMIGTTISDSGYIGALLNTGTKNCLMQGVTVKGSANKGIIDAGDSNELNSCQSFTNVGVNLDKVAAVANRTIGGFYEYGAEDGEEGFFNPTLNFGGTSSGAGTIIGNYRVNGSVIFFDIRVLLTSKGSEVGDVSIEGLPFVSKSDALPPVQVVASNLTYGGQCSALVQAVSQNILLYNQSSGGGLTRLNDGSFANNTELYLSGSYLAEL